MRKGGDELQISSEFPICQGQAIYIITMTDAQEQPQVSGTIT